MIVFGAWFSRSHEEHQRAKTKTKNRHMERYLLGDARRDKNLEVPLLAQDRAAGAIHFNLASGQPVVMLAWWSCRWRSTESKKMYMQPARDVHAKRKLVNTGDELMFPVNARRTCRRERSASRNVEKRIVWSECCGGQNSSNYVCVFDICSGGHLTLLPISCFPSPTTLPPL